MNKLIGLVFGGALLLGAGASGFAVAEESSSYAADAIATGDFASAERKLTAVLARDPSDPYALLNLAFVYQKSGQVAKAKETYQRILELKQNPLADRADGKSRPVKAIAQRGIESLEAEPARR